MRGEEGSEFGARVPIADGADVAGRATVRETSPSGEVFVRKMSRLFVRSRATSIEHATMGEIEIGRGENGGRRGIAVIAHDFGLGTADVAQALQDGYWMAKGLDAFEICSSVGTGTTITMREWA